MFFHLIFKSFFKSFLYNFLRKINPWYANDEDYFDLIKPEK